MKPLEMGEFSISLELVQSVPHRDYVNCVSVKELTTEDLETQVIACTVGDGMTGSICKVDPMTGLFCIAFFFFCSHQKRENRAS